MQALPAVAEKHQGPFKQPGMVGVGKVELDHLDPIHETDALAIIKWPVRR